MSKARAKGTAGENLAWGAGVLEGEGWFGVNNNKGRSIKPAVMVGSTDPDILHRLKEVFVVGNIHGPYDRGGNKPMWFWRVQKAKDALDLMALVRPWMGERRGEKIDGLLEQFS